MNIWLDNNWNQTEPDLIISYDGTEWKVDTKRTGCTINASGKIAFLYEGYNDISATHYTPELQSGMWFKPLLSKEKPEYWDSYCRPLTISCSNLGYTFSSNTLTANIKSTDWSFLTRFKVLIKSHASLKAADYYNLQVSYKDGSVTKYPQTNGAIVVNDGTTNVWFQPGSANNYGWAGGVQETDGIAFYYTYLPEVTATDFTFTLKEYEGTDKTYTVTGKTIGETDPHKCIGITLKYDNFH